MNYFSFDSVSINIFIEKYINMINIICQGLKILGVKMTKKTNKKMGKKWSQKNN